MKIPTLAEQFQERGFRMGKSEGRIEGEIKGTIKTLKNSTNFSREKIQHHIQNDFNLSPEEAEDYIKKYL